MWDTEVKHVGALSNIIGREKGTFPEKGRHFICSGVEILISTIDVADTIER